MKIMKFKKTTKGRYKLFFDNHSDITLYEDVIVNNNLLITKEIDESLLSKLEKQNNEMHVYQVALNYISIRMRSIKEMKEYLLRKGVNDILINKTIEKLVKHGFLNDFNFARAYTNDQLLITPKGPYKIKIELEKHNINKEIIEEVLDDIDNDMVREKLSNLMEKQKKKKKGSSNSVKTKIINYFNNLGYSREMILDELSNYKLKSDPLKLQKDYDKLYNKYKSKYEGSKLLYFISQKLYAKGYTSDEIKSIMERE